MTTQQPTSSNSNNSEYQDAQRPSLPIPKHAFSINPPRRRPHREPTPIDLSSIEIVDLTESSPPHGTRRPNESTSPERPSKRFKGKEPEVYISLDEDEEESTPRPSETAARYKSPSQTGSLSQTKCVICLDSPTDLAATPCGHLFCDFCIRSALKAGTTGMGRGRGGVSFTGPCPICRRKITSKSLIPLEIKVRTLG